MVLEKLFREMVGDSEGGYVLLDKKPLCIHGFHFQDFFLGENEKHRISVYLREGAGQWKKDNLHSEQSNIIIHSYNNQDSLVKNYIHVLFINKKLFLETVQNNLPLFQYVLGPSITPLELLAQLTNPDNNFHAVLKNDKVLIGILLGFGTQNSLYVSRIENLEEALMCNEQPPFISQHSKISDIRPDYQEMLLLSKGSWKNANSLEASYGYHSPKEEMLTLCKKIDVSSLKLANQTPNFVFGRLKEDRETDKLVKELEVTQLKINSLLSSKDFLKEVLQRIFPNERIDVKENAKQIALDDSEVKQLPFIVAASVWSIIEDENEVYKKAFFEGVLDADKGLEAKVSNVNSFEFAKTKALVNAKENISMADKCLLELNSKEGYVNVIPNRVCYKTLHAGFGDTLTVQSKVTVQYTIKTPDEKVLTDTLMCGQPVQLSLLEVIPGLALGMQNMRIGEIREIFIHPSLAYGLYTTLDKGIYLHVFIQLLAFEDEDKTTFAQINAEELPIAISPTIEEDYLEQAHKVAYDMGYRVWKHYKQDNTYQLAQIQEWIKQFEAGHSSDISLLPLQDLLNKHHWNIYHNQELDLLQR